MSEQEFTNQQPPANGGQDGGADAAGAGAADAAAATGAGAAAATGQAVRDVAATEVPWRKLHPLSPIVRGGLSFVIIFGVLFNFVREWLTDQVLHRTAPADYLPGSDDALETPGSGSWFINLITGHGWVLLLMVGILVFCLLAVLVSWLSWRAAKFRITKSAVEETHGIFARTHKRAPLERIQSVNLQRQLVVRLFGLASVDIHTAGQGGNLQLNYLSFRQAQELREEILNAAFAKRRERQGAAGGADAAGAAASGDGAAGAGTADALPAVGAATAEQTGQAAHGVASRTDTFADRLGSHVDGILDTDTDEAARAAGTIVRVLPGRLLASILLGWSFILFVLLTAAVTTITFIGTLISGEAFGLFMILPAAIPLLLAAVAIVYSHFNHGFNFTLTRAHDAVRVGSGLTSTQTETIPFGRIHALEASQPLLWRPFGWWHVRVVTAGHSLEEGMQKNGELRNVVLPVGTWQDVEQVMQTVLPGVYPQHTAAVGPAAAASNAQAGDASAGDAAAEAAAQQQGASALRVELSGSPTGFTGAAPSARLLLPFAWKRAGMRIDTAAALPNLRIRRGFFTRRLGVVPLFRAQSVAYSTPLLHRLCGAARIDAHTVPGFVTLKMRGINRETAKREFEKLSAAVLRAQLREAQTEHEHAA